MKPNDRANLGLEKLTQKTGPNPLVDLKNIRAWRRHSLNEITRARNEEVHYLLDLGFNGGIQRVIFHEGKAIVEVTPTLWFEEI